MAGKSEKGGEPGDTEDGAQKPRSVPWEVQPRQNKDTADALRKLQRGFQNLCLGFALADAFSRAGNPAVRGQEGREDDKNL